MQTSPPLLSIITATFNSEKTLERTFQSLLVQQCNDFEYIVIDGNSSDNTLDIIKQFETAFQNKGISFHYLSESDSGIYDAWNKGINLASGKWIAFLGSDDFYVDNALKIYKNTINKIKEVDLIYGNVKVVLDDKEVKIINGIWSWKIFRRRMNIAHVGAFHNLNYFKNFGNFDISYRIAGDYELLLRKKDKLRAHHIDKILAVMSEGGVSNNQVNRVLREAAKAKNQTAGLHRILCAYDRLIALLKYSIKKMIYAISR